MLFVVLFFCFSVFAEGSAFGLPPSGFCYLLAKIINKSGCRHLPVKILENLWAGIILLFWM